MSIRQSFLLLLLRLLPPTEAAEEGRRSNVPFSACVTQFNLCNGIDAYKSIVPKVETKEKTRRRKGETINDFWGEEKKRNTIRSIIIWMPMRSWINFLFFFRLFFFSLTFCIRDLWFLFFFCHLFLSSSTTSPSLHVFSSEGISISISLSLTLPLQLYIFFLFFVVFASSLRCQALM